MSMTDGEVELDGVTLTPTVTHVSRALREYQVFLLSGYGNELAAAHAVEDLTLADLRTAVWNTVPAAFLPKEFVG